ncbi:unnamed protein product [Microthlaspi erraticum]|uniref:Uncharacterized protein n=1 Tax=Microthlaspi erraticum TaxID=1685480 RepID=A0A6D2JG52_9BRAS|nr:unnamed protein product [Microthlaspi erraticum]
MDFIKTSSLRALIERLYRESASKPHRPAGRGTNIPRSAKVTSVRLKSRPKFETDRPITQYDPGNIAPRSAKLQPFHATPCTTTPREPVNKASRPRNPTRVPRPMHPSDPGNNVLMRHLWDEYK